MKRGNNLGKGYMATPQDAPVILAGMNVFEMMPQMENRVRNTLLFDVGVEGVQSNANAWIPYSLA